MEEEGVVADVVEAADVEEEVEEGRWDVAAFVPLVEAFVEARVDELVGGGVGGGGWKAVFGEA